MDDCKVLLAIHTIAHILRFHYPLPRLIMNRLTDWYEPVYQGTWVVQPFMDEGEEKVYSANAHAHESIVLGVGSNEDGVTTRVLVLPQRGRANVSVIHAACSAEVARSVEPCNRGVVNEDTTIEFRTATERDSHGVEIGVRIQLLKEKLSYQCGQLWLPNVGCQICYVFWILPFCNTKAC